MNQIKAINGGLHKQCYQAGNNNETKINLAMHYCLHGQRNNVAMLVEKETLQTCI